MLAVLYKTYNAPSEHQGLDVPRALVILGHERSAGELHGRITFWMLGLWFTPSGQIFAGSEAWIRAVKADSASEFTYNRGLMWRRGGSFSEAVFLY